MERLNTLMTVPSVIAGAVEHGDYARLLCELINAVGAASIENAPIRGVARVRDNDARFRN